MVPPVLIALTLVGPPKAPAPVCTLAGPPVQARWSGTIPPASTADAPLRLVADEPLPGNASRFDYQSLESASGRLFISHMGAGQLVVFDVRAGRVIGNLDGFPTVTGVLAVPGERRAYASATGDHAVVVVDDPATTTIVRRITFDEAIRYPHGVYIDAQHRFAFITGQESGTLGLQDLRTLQLRQVLTIGSDPDVLAFDPALGRLYVAAESGVVAVLEQRDGSLVQLGWYRAPRAHSVAVDPATYRVYLPLADVSGHPVLRVLVPSDSH